MSESGQTGGNPAESKPSVISQEYALVPVDQIRPHPENPRQADNAAIDESIAQNGFYGTVIVQKSSGLIIAGRHRWERAKAVGITEVPVLWADVNDLGARRIMLADNRTSDRAGYDERALAEVLEAIRNESGSLEGTGYDEAAFNLIIEQAGNVILAQSASQESTGEPEAARDASEAESDRSQERRFAIIIECEDQAALNVLMERFSSEGLKCHVYNSRAPLFEFSAKRRKVEL